MPESNSCLLCNKEQLVPSILAVENNIKFTREVVRRDGLSFLDCALHTEEDRSLNTEEYRKPTHKDTYLLFNSHHPLEHKLGVFRTLNHWFEGPCPQNQRGRNRNTSGEHLKSVATLTGPFVKPLKDLEQTEMKRWKIGMGISQKLRRIFNKHNFHFLPSKTLR